MNSYLLPYIELFLIGLAGFILICMGFLPPIGIILIGGAIVAFTEIHFNVFGEEL